jgi:hypothetical protein
MRTHHHHDSDYMANLRWDQAFSQLRAPQDEKVSAREACPTLPAEPAPPPVPKEEADEVAQ